MAEPAAELRLTPPVASARAEEAGLFGADVTIWRYPDMCRHWGVSRATIERWVRQYDETGVGIPVHRDPSGRPYWLAHEASGVPDHPRIDPVGVVGADRLAQLRRAARRRSGPSGRAR
ncbi:helix-turn-helix domain-containing protein [Nitriliruptoraceae bacterium ZYF776]|nr:helix-turn-helix domain-containing protein [Profundirhabdus halotolerans]